MKKTLLMLMLAGLLACSATAQQTADTTEKKKPKNTYRVGTVSVAVWEHTHPDGKIRKTFQVQNSYTVDGKWKTSNNFNEKELLELKAVIDKAINEEAVKEK